RGYAANARGAGPCWRDSDHDRGERRGRRAPSRDGESRGDIAGARRHDPSLLPPCRGACAPARARSGSPAQPPQGDGDRLMIVLSGARIFDGERFRDDHAVVVEGERIAAIVPYSERPRGAVRDLDGGLLAPGYIDVQVNGGGGVLFNEDPTPEGIAR